MGLYINPQDGTKTEWLEANGVQLNEEIKFPEQGNSIVCLIDNGVFDAAAVAYSERELEHFQIDDGRNKKWYIVPTDKIFEVCPDAGDYLTAPKSTSVGSLNCTFKNEVRDGKQGSVVDVELNASPAQLMILIGHLIEQVAKHSEMPKSEVLKSVVMQSLGE